MSFRHADHLVLAIECLRESPSFDAALERMSAALRTKANAAGTPEKYHHTVTIFWMRMVEQLMDKDLPLAYYSPELLATEAARVGWVEPDLKPLPQAPSPGQP